MGRIIMRASTEAVTAWMNQHRYLRACEADTHIRCRAFKKVTGREPQLSEDDILLIARCKAIERVLLQNVSLNWEVWLKQEKGIIWGGN